MFLGSYLHARYVYVAQIFSSKSTRYFSQVRRRDKLGRLKPLSLSARVSLLRSHGILQIDRRESAAIERIQVLSASHILVTLAMSPVSRLVVPRSAGASARAAVCRTPAPAPWARWSARWTGRASPAPAPASPAPTRTAGGSSTGTRSTCTGGTTLLILSRVTQFQL